MRIIGTITLLALLFVGCVKPSNEITANYNYEYFPLEVGQWSEYEVEEVFHTALSIDTSRYWLKEVITESFEDLGGRTSYRIERFWKTNMQDEYTIKDVWYANRTQNSAERIEENVRFVRLIFPLSLEKEWDGNLFNVHEEWNHEVDSLHVPLTLNNLVFDSVAYISQYDNVNPFQNQVASEIYAKNVGLIKKDYVNIDNNIGNEIRMELVSYGK